MDKHVYFLLFSYEHAIHSTVLVADEDGGGNAPLKIQLPQGERKVLQLFGPGLNGLFAEQIGV